MKHVKIALVGCGGMAASYRHIYTEIPGAELAVLVDADERVAREAAQQLRCDRWSVDFRDCLAPDINMVDISTPNFLHRDQAVSALKAGKHILCQKPLATMVAEAEEIVTTASESGMNAGMYMYLFDNPLYYDIKKLIDTGKMGAISGVHCRCAHTGGLHMADNSWRKSKEKTGGGSFIQLAIHNLNMLQWLIGEKIISVMAYSKNMMCQNIGGDDVTTAAYEFESGILGTVSSAYCAEKDELSIFGTKGYVSIDDNRNIVLKLKEGFSGGALSYEEPGEINKIYLPNDGFPLFDAQNPHDQHVAFVKAVQNGAPPPIPLKAGLHDMKIVQAIYESAKQEKRMSV